MNALTRIPGLQPPRLDERPLVIGLINNMPDSAVHATERQFTRLLARAAGQGGVVVHGYTLPEIPRDGLTRQAIEQRYRPLRSLRDDRPDALIVSGAAPTAPSLRQEPYWATLTEVLDWAAKCEIGLVLSCLAAHAAVLHAHNVQRQRLARKCSGVFAQEKHSDHAFLRGAEGRLCTPHSRWNDVPVAALENAGYAILTESERAGADVFAHPDMPGTMFLNGHPEYDGNTLMKEYRRDVSRFLRGEQPDYPDAPHADAGICLTDDAAGETPWQNLADSVFANWIDRVRQRVA